MNVWKIIVAGVGLLIMSGCASITSETMQSVNVTAESQDGTNIQGAECNLNNDKGTWKVQAPGYVSVHKSYEDLMVTCRKEDTPDGFVRAISRPAAGMYGNIIIGGVIGAVIDHSRGAGYNYPESLSVTMGKMTVLDRNDKSTTDTPEADADQSAMN